MAKGRATTLCLLLIAGCGSPGGNGAGDAVIGGGPDLASAPNPVLSYGHEVGQVMPDFTAAGYRLSPAETDSARLTWDPGIELYEYRADPSCKCLLITVCALWCTACQREQAQLVTDVSRDPSFCVLAIVQDGPVKQVMATRQDVDAWTQRYSQNFSVVQGTPSTEMLLSGGSGSAVGLPLGFVLDPATMKVLDVVEGFVTSIHDDAVALCEP